MKRILRKRILEYRTVKSTSQKNTKLRFQYGRYADDWIILKNADKNTNEKIKTHISKWLSENLKFTWSEEKTNITDIKKQEAKFLGFTLRNLQRSRVFNKYEQKLKNGLVKTIKKRTTTDLFLGIDKERVLNRFKWKGFFPPDGKPRRHSIYLSLTPWEIVQKYRQIMEGRMQYYSANLTYKSHLGVYHSMLTYSCYHTRACRTRKSRAKVRNTYGQEWKMTRIVKKQEGKQVIS